jgi:general secretion pathway protein G
MDNHIEEKQDKGFTLVELLIVIVILGILATVTVFAVRGITDQGKTSTCKADKKTLETAVEAYFAANGMAAIPTEAQLVPSFLHSVSPNYDITAVAIAADPGPPATPAYAAGDVIPQPGNTNGCT